MARPAPCRLFRWRIILWCSPICIWRNCRGTSIRKAGPAGDQRWTNGSRWRITYGNHEWYEGDGFLIPRIYSGYWSQFMQKLAAHLPSAYMHAEGYPNWGFDGPKLLCHGQNVVGSPGRSAKADPAVLRRPLWPCRPGHEQLFHRWRRSGRSSTTWKVPNASSTVWSTQFTTHARQPRNHCNSAIICCSRPPRPPQTDDQKKRIALFTKCFAFSECLFALSARSPPSKRSTTRPSRWPRSWPKTNGRYITPPNPIEGRDQSHLQGASGEIVAVGRCLLLQHTRARAGSRR